jgi:hypothetical protein
MLKLRDHQQHDKSGFVLIRKLAKGGRAFAGSGRNNEIHIALGRP